MRRVYRHNLAGIVEAAGDLYFQFQGRIIEKSALNAVPNSGDNLAII